MSKITEINTQTNEKTVRDMTEKELEQIQKADEERLAKKQAKAERQAKLESAKAKLAALGLDEAEVNAILGL